MSIRCWFGIHDHRTELKNNYLLGNGNYLLCEYKKCSRCRIARVEVIGIDRTFNCEYPDLSDLSSDCISDLSDIAHLSDAEFIAAHGVKDSL